MSSKRLAVLAGLYFTGACFGLYLLMQSMQRDVPTGYIVGFILLFAILLGWVGGK